MFFKTQDNDFIQRVEKGNKETSSSSSFFFFFFFYFLPNYKDLYEKHVRSSDLFFTDAYSMFSLFKRHHEIPLLRIQNLTFGSPLFLKWSLNRWQFWHEIGHVTLSCTGPIAAISSDHKWLEYYRYSSTILIN